MLKLSRRRLSGRRPDGRGGVANGRMLPLARVTHRMQPKGRETIGGAGGNALARTRRKKLRLGFSGDGDLRTTLISDRGPLGSQGGEREVACNGNGGLQLRRGRLSSALSESRCGPALAMRQRRPRRPLRLDARVSEDREVGRRCGFERRRRRGGEVARSPRPRQAQGGPHDNNGGSGGQGGSGLTASNH